MMGDTCAAMSVQAAVERSPDELPLLEAKLDRACERVSSGAHACSTRSIAWRAPS
jgi:hypothetical protein